MVEDLQLLLEDVYLYGAWVEDVSLDAWELRLTFGYPPAAPGYQDLWPHINVARGTLVFAMRSGVPAVPKNPKQPIHRQTFFPSARDFARRFEESDEAWSLAGVAAIAGGFVIEVREAGEFGIAATECTVRDVEPFAPDPDDAQLAMPAIAASPAPDFEHWLSHQYLREGEVPPSSGDRRSPLGGYYMVFGGGFGLVFAFCLTVLPVLARAQRPVEWPVGLGLNLFFAIIVYWGYRVLRRAAR